MRSPGGGLQADDDVLATEPLLVVAAELRVAPALGVGLLVLEMQQLERDVLAAFVFTMDVQPIGFGPI
jgi:hypothetical protein